MPSQFGWRRHHNVDDDDDDDDEHEDGDKVVPLHCEEAFKNGLTFKAKFIGSMIVPRPTRRMEIVVAMRQVRYNTKAKQTAKVKCLTTISVKGVRSIRRPSKKKKNKEFCNHEVVMMNDPIYRIFYVSHDSHDLNIWSYISREASTNTFRCNVFKCTRKSKAMKVVRTIGQAFEVCHKITQQQQSLVASASTAGILEKFRQNAADLTPMEKKAYYSALRLAELHGWSTGNELDAAKLKANGVLETDIDAEPANVAMETDIDADDDVNTSSSSSKLRRVTTDLDEAMSKDSRITSSRRKPLPSTTTTTSNNNNNKSMVATTEGSNKRTISSSQQHIRLLKQQSQLADQQTQIVVNQVKQLRAQLKIEINSKNECQARNHQLLVQNRELIQQLSELVAYTKTLESKLNLAVNDEKDTSGSVNNGLTSPNDSGPLLSGIISLSNLEHLLAEEDDIKDQPCTTTVIANDNRIDTSQASAGGGGGGVVHLKQQERRRHGVSGHSYFSSSVASSSDDSSLQTLTNRLSESQADSCSTDSSTSSDDEGLFDSFATKRHTTKCHDNAVYNGIQVPHKEPHQNQVEENLTNNKLTSLIDDKKQAINKQLPDTSNNQIDATSIWTTGNTESQLQLSEKIDAMPTNEPCFTLSPIPKIPHLSPTGFEESFSNQENVSLKKAHDCQDLNGSFSDLRKIDTDVDAQNDEINVSKSTEKTTENLASLSSTSVAFIPSLNEHNSAEFDNIQKENYSLFDTDFAEENAASFASFNSNNNNRNPFTGGGDTLFNESEFRYEPLRKVQDADKYRSGGKFTSLQLDTHHTDEPSLNSILDSVETSSLSSSQHNNG